jgi:DNA-binding winged helix-turn-helix (wHTH) protein
MAVPQKKVFRFGVFEADTSSGELRKSGVRMRLQEQPFRVLVFLLERPGEVVGREELRQKLWPADTFVDFDRSLNTIINKLRETLGDSAANPRFIETLAKRGYRFLIPVELAGDNGTAPPATATMEAQPTGISQSTSLLTHPDEVPEAPRSYVRILFLLIQVMYLCFYIVALARLAIVEDLLQQAFGHPHWIAAILIVSAAIGIPLRLYLVSAVSFDVRDLGRKFLKLFPAVFLLDELWALSPFLLAPQFGLGLALAITAALLYVPFAQRTLLLMRDRTK